MPVQDEFTHIDIKAIRQQLDIISSIELVIVTLVSGDTLFGSIFKHKRQDDETLWLSFNTSEGRVLGRSYLAVIPFHLVSAVEVIPLEETSIPTAPRRKFSSIDEVELNTDLVKLAAQDYPNPLATIIFSHNIRVAKKNKLKINDFEERALSKESIPVEGIFLKKSFLLYSDSDFFLTQSKGSTNISASPIPGLITIERDVSLSLEQHILQRLKSSLGDEIRRHVSPSIGDYILVQGCLLASDPTQDEIIEGKKCSLYSLANNFEMNKYFIRCFLRSTISNTL